jgi:O-antigen/teichoic acid export membrane protein
MKFIKQVYVYFGSSLLNGLISFSTVALLTKQLSPEDYGIINLYSSFIIFLMAFISGGVLYPLSAEFYKRDEYSFGNYFTNAQVIPLLALTLISFICFFLANHLANFLRVTPIWIYLIPLTTWFIFINETSAIIARVKNKPWIFVWFSAGKGLLEMLLSLLFIVGMLWGWQGRLSSALFSTLFLFFFSAYYFFHWGLVCGPIDWRLVKAILYTCVPFIFERLSIFFLGNSDKYFIANFYFNGIAEVGLYSLAGQIGSIIFIALISMNNAYQPYLFQKLSDGHRSSFHRATVWYIGALVCLIVALYLGIPLIFEWFIDEKYKVAQYYSYVLTAGYFMWGIYNAFLGYLVYFGKTRQIFYMSITGMALSITLNLLLVPTFGAWGAATSSAFTYFFMAGSCIFYANKCMKSKKSL